MQRPGQDPVHPETAQPSRGKHPDGKERRREEDLPGNERDLREDDV
ncbi:hypothetical protein [Streptomyces sp. NBC_01264]|nr:hypothetical protein [Streptomyces sp. NBC_01264]MCX4775423.1 hypothetical protein [Streptomyces sp. NBC_01264]